MSIRDPEASPTSPLIEKLRLLLHALHDKTFPEVSDPPSCKKRAAVALIIRVRPNFPDHAVRDNSQQGLEDRCNDREVNERLESFFDQGWVQRGDPEILFIRRATRKGDRWTGHVAFPGGKRESSDADDRSTSIRETEEEIGLDLAANHSLYIGNLAQRVVTTAWGKVPLVSPNRWSQQAKLTVSGSWYFAHSYIYLPAMTFQGCGCSLPKLQLLIGSPCG